MAAKKQLLHTPVRVTVNGEKLEIKPFPFGQLHIVTAKLMPIFSLFKGLREGDAIPLADIVQAGGENLQEVLAMAACKPREWMDTIYEFEEGQALVLAVFEANRDQFLKKILPSLMSMVKKAAPAPTPEAEA
jgi:hypothetical protein